MSPKRIFIGTLIIWCVSLFGFLWFANDAFSELFGFGCHIVFSPTVSALLMIPIILLLLMYILVFGYAAPRGTGNYQMQKSK